MADATFTGLPLESLTAMMGSRTRALAARRWLCDVRPVPAVLPEWRLAGRQESVDGTVKLALALRDASVETVLIPADERSTVCVSSQAGCTRHCVFCATATLGFRRQLTAGEIVLQYLVARAEAPADRPPRNVVFMGMGEPMDNLDAVLEAVSILTDDGAPRLSSDHVTVSTAGVLPGMGRFLRSSRAQLALSLNATTDEQRERLMPHNRVWPIASLLGALREDHARGSRRRYFVEYVLWRGVNDTDDDARRLVALLAGLPAHVNLIPHNPFAGSAFEPPSPERVLEFQRLVHDEGVRCLVRWPRGREIAAACGQLALRVAGG